MCTDSLRAACLSLYINSNLRRRHWTPVIDKKCSYYLYVFLANLLWCHLVYQLSLKMRRRVSYDKNIWSTLLLLCTCWSQVMSIWQTLYLQKPIKKKKETNIGSRPNSSNCSQTLTNCHFLHEPLSKSTSCTSAYLSSTHFLNAPFRLQLKQPQSERWMYLPFVTEGNDVCVPLPSSLHL